ncbi:MAG: XRE family transcriptional regulator [Streptosporangiaceae bacterium]
MRPTSLLKAHRLAWGVALDDVVEQVRALFETDGRQPRGLTTSLLSCYESGRKSPGAEYLHYLCLVYGASPRELGYDRPCVCGEGHRDKGARVDAPAKGEAQDGATARARASSGASDAIRTRHGSWSSTNQVAAASALDGGEEEDDDTLRRTMLQILGGAGFALSGSLLGSIDRIRGRMDETLADATVSPTMLDEWEETVAGYGRQYMSVPPLWLLLEVTLDFSEVRGHVRRRQPIEVQERLCRLAAGLAGLTGIIMIDLGDPRLSRSFFRTARSAADETGDRGLRAWVAVREAVVPLYYGDPSKAVDLARRAQGLAGTTPCAASAMAPALEARALSRLARLGHTDAAGEAERAIQRADVAFTRLPEGEQHDTAFGYTSRQLRFHQGNALTHLASNKARDVQAEALSLYSSSEALDRTLIRFDEATCYLQDREVEEALRLGRQVLLDTPPGHRTDIVVSRARELAAAVPASCDRLPATRDFREVLALGPASVDA